MIDTLSKLLDLIAVAEKTAKTLAPEKKWNKEIKEFLLDDLHKLRGRLYQFENE